jgi:hypothetical protein
MLFASHRIDEVATLARAWSRWRQGASHRESAVSQFVARLPHGAVLHLHMPRPSRQAIAFLSRGRLLAALNGVGMLVPVGGAEGRAVPRARRGRISIDDFELISQPRRNEPRAHGGRSQS